MTGCTGSSYICTGVDEVKVVEQERKAALNW